MIRRYRFVYVLSAGVKCLYNNILSWLYAEKNTAMGGRQRKVNRTLLLHFGSNSNGSICCRFVIQLVVRPITFLCTFPAAVARSSSGGVAICYVLPVLWMRSCFHTLGYTVRHV